jgi:hypothetical protein
LTEWSEKMPKTAEKTAEATLPLDGPVIERRQPASKSRAVAAHKAGPAQNAPATAVALATSFSPPELLHAAILQGADVEVIERLSALAERWQIAQDTRRARISFDHAMASAKAEMPIIRKNRNVKFKSKDAGKADTDYWHEDLAEVCDTVQAVFGKFGLFFRWRTSQPAPGQVNITCVLSHRDGHSEETDFTAAVDTSGNKNHIQAIKSAATYLERMTLLAAAGVAARGQDDDGNTIGAMPDDRPKLSQAQIDQLIETCEAVGCTKPKFLTWAKVKRFEDIPAELFDGCLAGLAQFQKGA